MQLGGQKQVLQWLALANDKDHPQVQRVLQCWRRSRRVHRTATDWEQPEAIVRRAGLSPGEFIGLVHQTIYDFTGHVGDIKAALAYGRMMDASIARATEKSGTNERKIHFMQRGYLPSSKGVGIQINNKNVQTGEDEPAAPGRPESFDLTARKVIRALPS